MSRKGYLDTLKKTNLRPKKVKIKEHSPEILMEQDRGMGDIHGEIIKFFKKSPAPTDEQVHKLAEEMGIDEPELERHIYMMLGTAIKKGLVTETISLLQELFTVMPINVDKLSGPRKDMYILRLGMIAELDAANFYEQLADEAESETVRKVMLDVAKEEKTHVGEFETLLEQIDEEYEGLEEKGEEEIKDLISRIKPVAGF